MCSYYDACGLWLVAFTFFFYFARGAEGALSGWN